jgi:hypothetical protein
VRFSCDALPCEGGASGFGVSHCFYSGFLELRFCRLTLCFFRQKWAFRLLRRAKEAAGRFGMPLAFRHPPSALHNMRESQTNNAGTFCLF